MRLRLARPGEAAALADLAGGEAAALAGLHVALAEDSAGTAGVMGLAPTGRLDPVWVAPGDRGRAAATALHDAIEAEALRGGLPTLRAQVGPALRVFLEHRGWHAVSEAGGLTRMERPARIAR